MHRIACIVIVISLAPGSVRLVAQGDGEPSVESRLLQILRDRGTITSSEYDELRALEARLRAEADLETKLEQQIGTMVARLADDQPRTRYKVGSGFSWETPDKRFALRIGGRLQVRFTYEENTSNTSAGLFDEGEPEFNVPLARVFFTGNTFETWLKYAFQLEVVGDTARGPGFFVIPETLELAVRAANVDWDNSTTNTAAREYLFVVGWFFDEHDLKLQADFGRVEQHVRSGNDDDEWRLRIQAQIVF